MAKAYNEENKTFEAFKFNEIKYILLSHLKFENNLNLNSKESIISSVLFGFKEKEFTEKNFIELFDKKIKEYFKKKEIEYTILTSLSIDYLPYRRLIINNSEINIVGKMFPKKYRSSREKLYGKHFKTSENDNFLKVMVRIKGKNYQDAFEKGIYDLNIFRSILCLNLNSFTEIPLSSFSNRPINKIRFGQFFSLHHSSGIAINEVSYWYDNDFLNILTHFDKEKKHYKKVFKWWLNKYKVSQKSHKNKLGDVLNLYVKAFDEIDKQTCFLKGWLTLENLLGTHDNKTIIRRCVSIYSDELKEYQKQILEGLRLRRNQIVHEGNDRINSIVNCYHIQKYIYNLIKLNNLKNTKIIKNNEDALKLLDYRSKDVSSIEREIQILRQIKK